MKKILLFIAISSVLNLACTEVNDLNPIIENPGPIVLKAELQKRVAQDNEFALDLLKKTIQDVNASNVFISPLSVSIALGMAWNGAEGTTRTEMEKALKMSGMSIENINEYYKIMQQSLPLADSKTTLKIANSIWYRNGFQIKQPFLDMNKTYFDAGIRSLDFSATWAVDTINGWCAQKTNNLVNNVIKEIPDNTMMYLINAVYFKGLWISPFEKKQTYLTNFTNELGQMTEVNMMSKIDTFNYCSDSYAQYLDLPYGNGAFSMTVILPASGKTTSDVLD
ncbi:MAG TPA: serpin family protein, partial [Bacteroidales bacterium]